MKRANSEDAQLVVNILSKAFDDNKSVNFVVKQDSKRKARIGKLMEYSFRMCQTFGEVWISNDEQACALILLPDEKRASIRSILWQAKLALSVIGIGRVKVVLEREAKIKSAHRKEPLCYLWFVGVNPEVQKRGIGSNLLKEVIRECETKKRPIYLETSVEKNLPWYQKFGFEIFHSLNLGYTLYLLRRGNETTPSHH